MRRRKSFEKRLFRQIAWEHSIVFRIHILTVSLQEADQQPSHLFCLSFFSHFLKQAAKCMRFQNTSANRFTPVEN